MDDENLALDPQIDYNTINGLSSEVKERLFTVRPTSIVRGLICLMRLLIDLYYTGSCKEDGRNDTDVDYLSFTVCSTSTQASAKGDLDLIFIFIYHLIKCLTNFRREMPARETSLFYR